MVQLTDNQVYECLYRSKFLTLTQVRDDVEKKFDVENISIPQIASHLERLVAERRATEKTVPNGEDPESFPYNSIKHYFEQYPEKKKETKVTRYYIRRPASGKGQRQEVPEGGLEQVVVYA